MLAGWRVGDFAPHRIPDRARLPLFPAQAGRAVPGLPFRLDGPPALVLLRLQPRRRQPFGPGGPDRLPGAERRAQEQGYGSELVPEHTAAAIALLVMTAEDEMADGGLQARMNVVHEAGLFQGRLGFTRAIVLLEEGCEEFSNIHGLGQIRFPKGNVSAKFEEIRERDRKPDDPWNPSRRGARLATHIILPYSGPSRNWIEIIPPTSGTPETGNGDDDSAAHWRFLGDRADALSLKFRDPRDGP